MVAHNPPRPEPRVVAAALAGDRAALERVIAGWLATVYAWCHRLGAGRIDAEEAAHDVMMTLMRRHATVRAPEALPSWLFSTCRRVVANHRRLAWWRRWAPGKGFGEHESHLRTDLPLERRELAAAVAEALDGLRPMHREVLVLCYLEERSVDEASELLGIPSGTVKSRLFHARRHFRTRFGEEMQ